jgi:hypothetical protein
MGDTASEFAERDSVSQDTIAQATAPEKLQNEVYSSDLKKILEITQGSLKENQPRLPEEFENDL